jgi:hypothetical protein
LDENFIIRKIDIPPILEALALGGETFFAFKDKNVYYKYPNGNLTLKRLPYQEKNFLYPKTFASGGTCGEFTVDVLLLKKALRLSNYMKAAAITFFGTEDSKIYVSPKNNVKFRVGVGELSEEGFTLVCDNLLRLVSTISDKEVSVKMVVTDTSVELIISNPVFPVEISLSRISSAQYRRDTALGKKLEDRERQKQNLADKGIVRGTKTPTAADLGINLDI